MKRKRQGTEAAHPPAILGDGFYLESPSQRWIGTLPPFPGCQLELGFLKTSQEIPVIWLTELDQEPKDNDQMHERLRTDGTFQAYQAAAKMSCAPSCVSDAEGRP